jgi:hypothetical protein
MNAAPSKAEQYALYAEMFAMAAGAIVLFVVGIILNWRVTKGSVSALLGQNEEEPPRSLKDVRNPLEKGGAFIMRQLSILEGPFRRVRRTMTMMIVVALLGIVFANSTIITVSGTVVRNDNVAAQWQRWTSYVLYMVLSTAAMAQYYALNEVTTWLFALIPAGFGMAMGVFVTLTSLDNAGGTDKVVNFSIWGGLLLLSLIPLFLIYTGYSILRRLWRAIPIVVHVLFALSLWIILWTGPEVGGKHSVAQRTASAWLYFAIVTIWTVANVIFFYSWRMGPAKVETKATDSVVRRYATGRTPSRPQPIVNLSPKSPHFSLGETRGPPPPGLVEYSRG